MIGWDAAISALFAAAARTHTALEFNAFPDRLALNDELVRRARDRGVVFAIDTDVHAVPQLDYTRYGGRRRPTCLGISPAK